MGAAIDTLLVVPCFNEAQRLDTDALLQHARDLPSVGFILVNDGSSDATFGILQQLAERDPEHFTVIDQQPNQGKAAAVHRGMVHALKRGVAHAGYWDADMEAPLSELPRMLEVLEADPDVDIVWGARVPMLGRSIQQGALRRFFGRALAFIVSITLRLPVYDTQCGAKLFRVTPDITRLFVGPFLTRHTFDVEIVARLLRLCRDHKRTPPQHTIYELPLLRYRDAPGSSAAAGDALGVIADLIRIYQNYLGSGAPPLPALPPAHTASQLPDGKAATEFDG